VVDLTKRLAGLSPAQRELLLARLRKERSAGGASSGTGPSAPARPPLEPRDRSAGGGVPLSFAQQRLWFLTRLDPESPVYHVPAAVRLRGALDLAALRASLERVVERHEVLRTTFEVEGDEVRQRVAERGELPFDVLDLTDAAAGDEPAPETWEELWRSVDAETRRGFDLTRGPLLRALVARLGAEDHVLVLTMHHIVSDAWSMGVLLTEMGALYPAMAGGTPDPLPPLPVQYADFALWQREWLQGEALEGLLAPWRDRLADAPSLALPTDRPRPATPSFAGAQRPIRLEGPTPRLLSFAQGQSASPFMVLLAAFAALLGRVSGAQDLVVGTPIANRNLPEIEGLIGFFVNSLALRIDLTGDPSFRELCRRVRDVALEAYAAQDLPFEKLVDELRRMRGDEDREPLFRVVLQVRNEPRRTPAIPGLALEPLEVDARTAKFDMVVNLDDQDGFGGVWKYATALFDTTTVARMVRRFESLVEEAVAAPERRLSEIGPLDAAERHALLYEWNGRRHPDPGTDSLVTRFAEQASRRPGAVAIHGAGEELTYGELDRISSALAAHLVGRGVRPGDLVGVLLERTPHLVAALLGVSKAGAAYVPLDPTHPPERLRYVLEDTGAVALVFEGELADELLGDPAEGTGPWPIRWSEIPAEPVAEALLALPTPGPEDLAYAIYTSGSTGRPKGVLVAHGQVVRLFDATAERFGFGPEDVWSFFHSAAFDFSVWEIWGALLHGGRLEVVPYWVSRSPEGTHALLRERGVTVLNQTPSAFRQLVAADASSPEGLDTLSWVIFGGETLDPRSLDPWWRRYGADGPALVNMYGITETTVHVTFRRLGPEDGEAHSVIGEPISDLRVYVTQPGTVTAPLGVPGELWVGGAGVAVGYLGRPALTAERFIPDAWGGEPGARLYRSGDLGRWCAGGELEFLGRTDHQIKIRGFRIEPGEIEAALREAPGVAEAVVLAVEEGDDQRRLVAFVVSADGGADEGSDEGLGDAPGPELRRFLGERLPGHMVPAAFVMVDNLPLTSTGKLDRRALIERAHQPAPETAPADRTEPRTELERRVAMVWGEVLGIEHPDVEADFFDLGGDSIRAAVLANRLQEVVGEIVHVVAVFDAPTVERLAAYLEESYPAAAGLGSSPSHGADAEAGAPADRVDRETLSRVRGLVTPLAPPPPGDVSGRNPEAIFVLAPPRSGTTLFRVLLGGHPDLFAPPELELLSFRTLAERAEAFTGRDAFWLEGTIRAAMELWGVGAEEARRRIEEREVEGWSTRRFYRELQEALGSRRLVDKTPSYTLDPAILARAEEEFEGARYIHLVRHPCGMACSFEEARLDQIFFRRPHGLRRRRLAEALWTVSQANILDFLERVPPERQHRVRFEDLVASPEEEMEKVAELLRLDLRPAMLDPYRDGARRMTDGIHAESRMLGDVKFHDHRTIDPSVAERWRERMDEAELGEPTRELAASLGYALDPVREHAPALPALPALSGIAAAEPAEAPLSFAQERLWFLDQLEPGLPVYNLGFAVSLEGALDRLAFQRALEAVVRRHGALRTTFAAGGSRGSHPVQTVRSLHDLYGADRIPMPVADLRGLPEGARRAEARRLAEAEGRRGFDLAAGPLMRTVLVAVDGLEHWALVTLHHVIADGWSLRVLLEEAAEAYAAFSAGRKPDLAPLEIQYTDFARWQRRWLGEGVMAGQLAYWRERLAENEPLELATDRPRPPVQTYRGDQRGMELPATLWRRSADLARAQGATQFMVLLGAFQAFLTRATGRLSVSVGSPVANRGRRELEGLIGFFVNMLVLDTDVGGEPTFREIVDRVRATALGAFAHQDVPFEKLVEELRPRRDPGRNPLFQVVFQTRIAGELPEALATEGLTMAPVDLGTRVAKFDLKLGLGDGTDDLAASLEYNTDLFDDTTAVRMLRQFAALAEGATADPDQRLSELPLLSAAERSQLFVEWNDTVSSHPAEAGIADLFEECAARTPDAVALVCGREVVTYGALDRWANGLAWRLRGRGAGSDDRVCLLMERSPEAIVAILAALKAGGAYVPIDPAFPAERRRLLLTDAQPRVVVAGPGLEGEVPEGPWAVETVGAERSAAGRDDREDPPPRLASGDGLAYMVYTSGSTGEPKGVAAVHRAVARLVFGNWYAELGSHEVVLQGSSLGFDASTLEVWGALLHGARLVLLPELRSSLAELGATIVRERVSVAWLTAALFEQMVAERMDDLRGVRQLLAGGDVLPVAQVRAAVEGLDHGAGAAVINGYGPTENTTFTCCHRMGRPEDVDSPVPIGRPVAGGRIYVLGPDLAPVPIGAPGELWAAGDGLARGYWRRPELTAGRFVPDPFAAEVVAGSRGGERMYRTGDRVRLLPDGRVQFLGRFDLQLKLRGFRVEPGEVEAALAGHPGVRDAVVLPIRHEPGDLRLVGFVLVRDGDGSDASSRELSEELRGHLRERLPSYMVPAELVLLDSFPVTPNGKVDRRALQRMDRPSAEPEAEHVAPRGPIEEALAALWAELLGRERVGAHDDFFDLGGHSLLATQLVTRLRELSGRDVPLRLVFEHPTPAGLAAAIAPWVESADGPLSAAVSGQAGPHGPHGAHGAHGAHGPDTPADSIEPIQRREVDFEDLFDELDSLTDEEAAQLLSEDEPS